VVNKNFIANRLQRINTSHTSESHIYYIYKKVYASFTVARLIRWHVKPAVDTRKVHFHFIIIIYQKVRSIAMYRFQDVARPAATAAKHFVGTPRKLHDSTLLLIINMMIICRYLPTTSWRFSLNEL